MTEVMQLINEVRQAGVILRADPPDLIIKPAERVSPDTKAMLKAHKPEILEHLAAEANMQSLEKDGICVAVWDTGDMRILRTEADSIAAIDDGGTIYSPEDMFHYTVTLTQDERRLFHQFKRMFGGTVEWNSNSAGK